MGVRVRKGNGPSNIFIKYILTKPHPKLFLDRLGTPVDSTATEHYSRWTVPEAGSPQSHIWSCCYWHWNKNMDIIQQLSLSKYSGMIYNIHSVHFVEQQQKNDKNNGIDYTWMISENKNLFPTCVPAFICFTDHWMDVPCTRGLTIL